MNVNVVATTTEGTLAALTAAVPLAKGSSAAVCVFVPHIVSSQTELEIGAESVAPVIRRYKDMAQALGADAICELCACVGLDALVERLRAARGTVIVGGPVGRWLTSPEERFANRLTRAGCHVLFAASGLNTTQRRVTTA